MKKIILLLAVCFVYASSYAQNQESTLVAPPPPAAAPLLPIPPPPPPPPPPLPLLLHKKGLANTNDKGYDLSIQMINGADVVVVKKKGKTEKITVLEWFEHKDYYETKYGILLPPPPVPAMIPEPAVPALPAIPVEH